MASITSVNTIDSILALQKQNDGGIEHCIVFAYITHFDIDGHLSIVTAKW